MLSGKLGRDPPIDGPKGKNEFLDAISRMYNVEGTKCWRQFIQFACLLLPFNMLDVKEDCRGLG
jgi:hypothetical protein